MRYSVAMAVTLTVEPFADTVSVEPGESMLQGLIRNGRHVRYGCKHGGCGTCRAKLVSGDCRIGEQTSYSLSPAKQKAGFVLLCATYVNSGNAVVDISKTMDIAHSKYMDGKQVTEILLEVDAVEEISPMVRRLRCKPATHNALRFMAGQYVEVEIPGGNNEWRDFSLSSDPARREFVEFLIKLRTGGRLSASLASGALRKGVHMRVKGPLGQFRMRRSRRPKVLVASGSGMAPIRAMLYELASHNESTKVTFFYGALTPDELILLDEMRALEAKYEWLEFVPVVQEDAGDWSGERGLVTEVLDQRMSSLRGKEVYLCGAPSLIDEAITLAESKGAKSRHVFFERFVPSG